MLSTYANFKFVLIYLLDSDTLYSDTYIRTYLVDSSVAGACHHGVSSCGEVWCEEQEGEVVVGGGLGVEGVVGEGGPTQGHQHLAHLL